MIISLIFAHFCLMFLFYYGWAAASKTKNRMHIHIHIQRTIDVFSNEIKFCIMANMLSLTTLIYCVCWRQTHKVFKNWNYINKLCRFFLMLYFWHSIGSTRQFFWISAKVVQADKCVSSLTAFVKTVGALPNDAWILLVWCVVMPCLIAFSVSSRILFERFCTQWKWRFVQKAAS